MSEQAQALFASFGPVSAGMAAHVLLMNVLAPATAILGAGTLVPAARRVPCLVAAMVLQLLLLWAWHAPPSLAAAMDRPALHLTMQLSLTLAAVWFWQAVADAAANRPWLAIASLLITSKVFCLLGVLLTFAPRSIYPPMAHYGGGDPFADQQLAGLMMLLACPLSYLVAAVVVASRWLLSTTPLPHRDEGVEVA